MKRLIMVGGLAFVAGAGIALAFPWPVPKTCSTDMSPTAGGMKAKNIVVNEKGVNLVVSWIAPSGYEYIGGVVHPHETREFPSYVGYGHAVRKIDGTCLGVYRAPFGRRFTGN